LAGITSGGESVDEKFDIADVCSLLLVYTCTVFVAHLDRSKNNRSSLLDVVLLKSGVEGVLGKKLVLIRQSMHSLLLVLKADSNSKTTGIVFHFYLSQK